MTNIQKTEVFLKEQFDKSAFFKEYPADGEYRLQHSYRVAYAAREIARIEDKRKWLCERLDWIGRRLGEKSGTETAERMIAERLLYQRQYYEKVREQMEYSDITRWEA